MKEGTLVHHPEWGKGLVLEKLWGVWCGPRHRRCQQQRSGPDDVFPPGVRVLWNKPKTTIYGWLLSPTKVYEEELTIISEVE